MVAGATGMVGERLLRILEERGFPVAELRPLGSERSVGRTVRFRGEDLAVRLAAPEAFDGADLAVFAATGALSRALAPEAFLVPSMSSSWCRWCLFPAAVGVFFLLPSVSSSWCRRCLLPGAVGVFFLLLLVSSSC